MRGASVNTSDSKQELVNTLLDVLEYFEEIDDVVDGYGIPRPSEDAMHYTGRIRHALAAIGVKT
jgi:hypothetical protein